DRVESGEIVTVGDPHACITILDLGTLDPRLVGFRRGFTSIDSTPQYGYLTPAADSIAVRLDLEGKSKGCHIFVGKHVFGVKLSIFNIRPDFGLHSVMVYDLRRASSQLAGFSSGFERKGP